MTLLSRSWTRSTSSLSLASKHRHPASLPIRAVVLVCLAAGLAGYGCRSHSDSDVRIDLGAVTTPVQASVLPGGSVSGGASQPIPAETHVIQGAAAMPAEANAVAAIGNIQDAVAEDETASRNAIISRLSSVFLRELEDQLAEDQAKLSASQKAEADQAVAELSKAYRAYAAKRFPLVVQLSAIVGFPDPDPTSKREPKVSMRQRDRLHAQSVQLRSQIDALDLQFEKQYQSRISALKASQAFDTNRLQKAFEADRAKIKARAEEAASQILVKATDSMAPLLASQPSEILPAVGKTEIALPAGIPAHSEAAPKLAHPDLGSTLSEAEKKQALTIWLRLNGYRLSTDPSAPDRTPEFRQWLKTYLPEPSGSH